jgi:hypothetical protein
MKGGGGEVDMGWTGPGVHGPGPFRLAQPFGTPDATRDGDGDENGDENEDEGQGEGPGEPSRGNLAGHVGIGSLDLPQTRSLPPAISFAR